jgi:hypothetical protein
LAAGADNEATDSKSMTALMLAAANGHDAFIELLLTAGADKEAKELRGSTAIFAAAELGRSKSIEVLLKAGADKDAKNVEGETALMPAALNGRDKCIEVLLSAGCDVNALANGGGSALYIAVFNNHIECVRKLVRAGADVSIQFPGGSLDDFIDTTDFVNDKDAMKAALRLPTSAAAATGEVCALCATTLSVTKRLRCGRCLAVCYCSQACQRSDWKGDHKQTCKAPSVVTPAPVAAAAKDDTSRQHEQTCDVPIVAAPVAKKKQYRCAQCDTTMEKSKSQKVLCLQNDVVLQSRVSGGALADAQAGVKSQTGQVVCP